MCAVAAGREENVRLLLDAGADVTAVNEYKESVIHMTKGGATVSENYD